MQQQPQQQGHPGLLLAGPQQQQRVGTSNRQCRQPGALLLAHINTSIVQQQQQQQQWGWPWAANNKQNAAAAHTSTSTSIPATGTDSEPSTSTTFCEVSTSSNAGSLQNACNQLATVALVPDSGSSSSSLVGQQQVPLDRFQLPQQSMQQLHKQQLRPPPGSQFASATFNGPNSSSSTARIAAAADRSSVLGGGSSDGLGLGPASPPVGLRALGRAINGEAGKLLGLLGAQLLMHVANLQRGMAALQQHQQAGQSAGSGQQQDQRGLGWRPRMPWQRQAAVQESGTARQQSAAWQASEAARQWVTRGIAAEARMELRQALACYTNAVTLDPGDVELICRLAKQWSDLTYEDGATVEQIQEVNAKAVEYAERAITMAPKAAGGYMASCVSRGRLALFSDNKTKVRLAKEAQEAARTALSLEPGNDLAHHLMGRWHFEMAQINFMVRQLIRLVYGAALAPGKFEDALTEFETAVALNPNKLIHRVELGRTHLRLGHKRQAYEHLCASMAMEVEDVNAKLQKEDAELLLDKLKGEFQRSVSWGGFSSNGATDSSSSSTGVAAAAAGGTGADDSSSSSSSSSSSTGVGAAAAGGTGADDSSSSSSSSSSGGANGGGAQ